MDVFDRVKVPQRLMIIEVKCFLSYWKQENKYIFKIMKELDEQLEELINDKKPEQNDIFNFERWRKT